MQCQIANQEESPTYLPIKFINGHETQGELLFGLSGSLVRRLKRTNKTTDEDRHKEVPVMVAQVYRCIDKTGYLSGQRPIKPFRDRETSFQQRYRKQPSAQTTRCHILRIPRACLDIDILSWTVKPPKRGKLAKVARLSRPFTRYLRRRAEINCIPQSLEIRV